MRAIWKGSISFGLVNVPISLYPATSPKELSFRLLRRSDLSPINLLSVLQESLAKTSRGGSHKSAREHRPKRMLKKAA